ncbi:MULTISPECIES: phosphoglycerate dehydrogenase [unclassified Rhodococcus (in: high G+C Gram-positive bacteria)]|uniref:phosphoglycerate dehydrogenase n=1 Tax=unclassified Rhodococcus (in: high G+C Gram-positive bacteria) TaxID=192944 RepID=UPI0006FE9B2E|nr:MULTISPECIES: phosphoglycerate dehydrogenase [unclassified Rhodococcus (in: high G+C Gram-positive bacteria)]KQU28534.1 hydroxyacid dehydrogenase [Rhodococcus sp. Leaf225]KQU47550.1 hydroxyacid dehydrogenase [Rhodococcus sp. Leaf258]
MTTVLITTDYLRPGDDVDTMLRAHGHESVHSPATGPRPDGEMAALLAACDAAILASEPVTAAMLDKSPTLRVIARSGVGYDSIDIEAATRNGVLVCNTPGANRHAVAEMTIALLLMCARRIGETTDGVRRGEWPRHDTRQLRGATLGIIGLGPSGRAVADLAHAFGMTVLISTGHPDPELDVTYVDKTTLLRESDFVSLHARAGGAPVIDAAALAEMKSTAYLVNTARGSMVDENALVDALRGHTIAGAALDVFATEPPDPDNPLLAIPRVVATSHLAGQTREARTDAGTAAAQSVIAALAGRPAAGAINADALASSIE